MKEFIEKVKVTSLEIIVTGTKDKPYFEIKYKEVGKEDYNIGYSSYDLNNVFGWKEEFFEIINQFAEEYNNGWIPCSERLPEIGQTCICSVNKKKYSDVPHEIVLCKYEELYINRWQEWFTAWQPLPAPYQPKGE